MSCSCFFPVRRHGCSQQHIYLHATYTPCICINTETQTPFLIIAAVAAILRVMAFPCRNRQGDLSGPTGAAVYPAGSMGNGVEGYLCRPGFRAPEHVREL